MIAPATKGKAGQFVIPRWLDYLTAVKSGELGLVGEIVIPQSRTFDRDLSLLEENASNGLVADLLGKAFLDARPERVQLAKTVLKSSAIAEPTKKLARRIAEGEGIVMEFECDQSIAGRISSLRSELHDRPRNPTKWVDLARLYTAVGLDGKALKCMRVALGLAPEDRFVVRAFARFCIHTDRCDEAINYLGRHKNLLKDPWLLATAESLSKIDGRPSPLPKSVVLASEDEIQKFHRSELLESFAMAEWMHGKERVAKKAFRAAWETPSQNVIRHAEWFTGTALRSLRPETQTKFVDSNEAAARAALSEGNVIEGLRRCELWRFEEPYSVHPLAFESYLLCLSERFEQVVVCYDKARDHHLMSTMLFNNYTYATLMLGNSELGHRLLAIIGNDREAALDYFLKANEGLLALTRYDVQTAKILYSEAEELADSAHPMMKDRVFLHRCRAFLKFGEKLSEEECKRVNKIKKERNEAELHLLIHFIEKNLEAAK